MRARRIAHIFGHKLVNRVAILKKYFLLQTTYLQARLFDVLTWIQLALAAEQPQKRAFPHAVSAYQSYPIPWQNMQISRVED